MSRPVQRFYRPELDTLRFIAFFAVFTHHAFVSAVIETWPSLPWALRIPAVLSLSGQFGVDLFFVLSAYLISELLLRERRESGKVSINWFYARRILRIWPLYFTFVVLCAVLPAFTPAVFPHRALVFFILLSGNIYFTLYGGFPSPVAPLWSVSIEEQFYLVWPWILRWCNQLILIVISVALVGVAFSTRLVLLIHGAQRHVLLFNSLTRIDDIGIGALFAVLLKGRIPRIHWRWRASAFSLGVVLWWAAAAIFNILQDSVSPFNGMMGYGCGTAGAVLFFVAFLGGPDDGLRFLTFGPLAYLGRISYGLYVVHQLVLEAAKVAITKYLGRDPLILRYLLALAVVIPIAAASYRWFEAPFLRLKHRYSRVQTAPDSWGTGSEDSDGPEAVARDSNLSGEELERV